MNAGRKIKWPETIPCIGRRRVVVSESEVEGRPTVAVDLTVGDPPKRLATLVFEREDANRFGLALSRTARRPVRP